MMQKKRILAALLTAALLLGMLPAVAVAAENTVIVTQLVAGSDPRAVGSFATLEAAVEAIDSDADGNGNAYTITITAPLTVSLTESLSTVSLPKKATVLDGDQLLTFSAGTGVKGVVELQAKTNFVGDIATAGTVTLQGNGHALDIDITPQEGARTFTNIVGGGGTATSSWIFLRGGSLGKVTAGGPEGGTDCAATVVLGAADVSAIEKGAATTVNAGYIGPTDREKVFGEGIAPVRLGDLELKAGSKPESAELLPESGWTNADKVWAVPVKADSLGDFSLRFTYQPEGKDAKEFTDSELLLEQEGELTADFWVNLFADGTGSGLGGLRTVGIDRTPPAPPALTAAGGSKKVELSAAATDALSGVAKYHWYLSDGDVKLGETTTKTFTHTGLENSTKYTYYVVAEDKAGNLSEKSANKTATTGEASTLGYKVSTTGQKGWNSKNFSITVDYTAGDGHTLKKAKYALVESESRLAENNKTWIDVEGGSATFSVRDEGKWYLHVYVGDSSTKSDVYACVGLYGLDKTEPELESDKTYYKSLSSNSVIITGEYYSDNLSEMQYTFSQSRNRPTDYTWQSGKTKTFSALAARTDYSFWMKARDAAGNESDWELITLTTKAAGATVTTGGSSSGGGVVSLAPNNFEPLKNDMIRLGSAAIDVSPGTINITQPKYTLRPVPNEGVSRVYFPIQVIDSLNSQVQTRGTRFSLEINSTFGALQLPINFVQDHEELTKKLAQNSIGRSNGYLSVVQTDRSYDAALAQQLRNVLPGATIVRAGDFAINLVVESGASYGAISTFSQPLTHVFNIPADTELGSRWGVVRQKGTDFEFVPGRLVDGQVHSTTPGNSVYLVIQNEVAFDDVASGSWFYDHVGRAAAKKLLVGVGDNLFQPDRSITRAEFVQLLARALVLPATEAELPYGDVSAESWYHGAISSAYSAGLLNSLSGGSFSPNAPILREEMAALLSAAATYGKLADLQPASNLADRFTDAAERNTAYDAAVLATLERGFMEGMGDGTFAFKGHSTRAQAAKVILSLLESLGYIDVMA